MTDKNYFYHDEESDSYKIGGEPVEQEQVLGQQMDKKLDKKAHDY